ncbi:hypothetical protein ACJRO7_003229 [Eucalyptus globulus]|uniref:Uncharacterized protein n=1 Tax=Eucalyptus globulus TaxID=34317 RepID=A0ABD3IW52_EUCGL
MDCEYGKNFLLSLLSPFSFFSPKGALDGKGRSDIKHSTNFARAIPHSGYVGGSAHGVGEGGTNSESGLSSPKGSAAMIPIYVGTTGANNSHHQSAHHGPSACIHSPARVHALTAAVLALYCVFV